MNRIFYIGLVVLLSSCGLLNKGTTDSKKGLSDEEKDLKFQDRYFDAEKEKALDNVDKAYDAYILCLEINPEVGAVYYELAKIDLKRQNPRKAIESLETALKLEPENKWYILKMGEAQTAASNYEEATKYYDDAISLSPKDFAIYELKAKNFKLAQNIDGAIKTYNNLEKITSITEETSLAKFDLYVQSGKNSQAENELLKLIEAYPNEIRYNGILAEFYAGKGDTEKALVQYEKMKEKDPNNGILHWQLSQHYAAMGELEKSFDELKIAFVSEQVSMDNKVAILKEYYNQSLSDPKETNKAIELSKLIETEESLDPEILNIQGNLYFLDEDPVSAEKSYKRAIEQGGSKLSYWMDLLLVNYLSLDYKELKTNSDEALELFPFQPEIYLYAGLANLRLEDTKKAILSLKAGLGYVIENPTLKAHFYLLLSECYQVENSNTKFNESLLKMKENAAEATYKDVKDGDLIDIFGKTAISKKYILTALNWYEYQLKTDKANPLFLERMGDVYISIGQKQFAKNYWQLAEQAGGNSDELKKKLN